MTELPALMTNRPGRVRRYLAAVIAFVLSMATFNLPASQASSAALPDHLAGLDEHVDRVMQTMELPGLSLTIVDQSGVVVAKGYGVRQVGKSSPVDADTLFEIGSITKAFSATAVAVLVEQGKIDWDTPLRLHIPYFALSDPGISEAFTLADALSHRGGYADSYYYDVDTKMDRQEVIRRLRYEKPILPFRSGFAYHNAIFAAGVQVIPVLTGTPWSEFVQQKILDPLGMTSTLVSLEGMEAPENIATPHVLTTDGMQAISRSERTELLPEAGSILSNANDMARWCQFQIGAGGQENGIPLGSETLAQMRSQYASGTFSWFGKWGYGNRRAGYGLGWKLLDYRDDEDQQIAHGGAVDGVQSWLVFSPKKKYCIAMMSNGDWSGDAAHFAIANWIHDRYLGLEKIDWVTQQLQASRESMLRWVRQQAAPEGKNADIPFSQPLADYAGSYTNPSYGRLHVSQKSDSLEVHLGKYKTIAEHWRGEVFFLDWAEPGDTDAFLIFDVSPAGEVTGLVINWDGDKFLFDRQP